MSRSSWRLRWRWRGVEFGHLSFPTSLKISSNILYRQAHADAVSYNLFAVRLNLVASIWEEM
eukprot:scaffold2265_cov98-Skeletonema_dohrnii-CCMP3373.AAC.3